MFACFHVCSCLGLGLSSVVKSERQSALVVPFLIIPMILFSAKGLATSDTLQFVGASENMSLRTLLTILNPARHFYEIGYHQLSYREIPAISTIKWEFLICSAMFLAAFVLTFWRLIKIGRPSAFWVGRLTSPDFGLASLSDLERQQVVIASQISQVRLRCPRCGYRVVSSATCSRCQIDPRTRIGGQFLKP